MNGSSPYRSLILLMVLGMIIVPIIQMNDHGSVEGAPVSVNDEIVSFNATEDVLFQEVIEPVDIEGGILSWNISDEPGWIDFLNGSIYGTPHNDDVGWNNFTVSASNQV